MSRPDIVSVLIEGKSTLRVTHDERILLAKGLDNETLQQTIVELAGGFVLLRNTALTALVEATGDLPPTENCLCPHCNLRRLRDVLSTPALH